VRLGGPNITRAWAKIRGGLTPSNREQFADAAYELICEDYTAIHAVARDAGLDKSAVRALIEDAADRAWLKIAGLEPEPRETRFRRPQRPTTDAEPPSNPNKGSTQALPLAPTCEGCGGLLAGRRKGARFHSDACRMRASRRRDKPVSYLGGTVESGNRDDPEMAMREGAQLARSCSCPRPTPSRSLDRDNTVAVSCLKCGHPMRRLDAAA
jgi:hypothetical protein